MEGKLTIGRAALAAGCKVQTIRYYEQIGLLPRPVRSEGNQRLYQKADVDRLTFIRHARALGFPLDAVRDLLSLADRPDQPCEAADTIVRSQLAEVTRRIAQLQSLKLELERMVLQCAGGKISNCRVIEVLSDHSLCRASDHGRPEPVE